MFEWLLKYSAEQYRLGTVGFEAGGGLVLFVVVAAILALVVSVAYSLARNYRDKKTRFISLALRLAAIVLLCLPLLEPVLISTDVVPDENFVAVLLDDSASMSIADGEGGETRYAAARNLLERDGLLAELGEHFQLRFYRFSDAASRVDSLASAPALDGTATRLGPALQRVLADFRGVPLAGVIALTDGGDNASEATSGLAADYRAADVPLHVVGMGQEAFESEREILDVSVTKAVEHDTGAEIDVKLRSWARESGPVELTIYNGDEVAYTESRMLRGGGKIDQLTMFFDPPVVGVGQYRLEVEPGPNELNRQNNSLELLIDTCDVETRVLYFEGALRSDFKFIKRALEDDQVIDFVSVSRTGTGKYYRQGIRSPDELAGGFPKSEEELFQFKAVIFGDIEASAFSLQQQRMIERFVRERGGGFLMLGGRASFAEGDYWNTPIADMLPVALDPSRSKVIPDDFTDRDKEPRDQGFRFEPTPAGLENPILRLSADPATSRSMWSGMPGLTSINLLGRQKPGATVLARKPVDEFGDSEPLLVTQRYGRGRSTVLASASTWRWQMLLEAADFRHERFWRQLVRWQVASAPERVNIDLSADTPEQGQLIEVAVDVFDGAYRPVEGQTLNAVVEDPRGREQTLVLREELLDAGRYAGAFTPSQAGLHRITVVVDGQPIDATTDDGSSTAREAFLVRPPRNEFYDATRNTTLLRAIADESGGAFYEPAAAAAIPEQLRSRRTASSVYHSEYIWDAPLWLILPMLLLCAEWFYRRRKGLA